MAKKIRIQAELDDSKLRKQLDDIGKRKEKVTVDIDSGNIDNADQSMKHLNRTVADSNSVFSKLRNTISNTFSSNKLAMTGYLMVLNEINKAGKNAKQTIQEIDKAVTDLSVATNMSRESVTGLIKDYNTYAKQLSSTTTQITSAADDYLRAGKSMSETQALIKDSIMLSKLGQLESGAATEDLLAVMNGYEMSIDEVGKALDAMVAIDLKASTSAGDIATALKYCASSADVAGLSFNKLAAYIATIQEKTMQSAETIGTFMNTILSRYRNVKIGQFVDDDGEDLSEVETILDSLNIKLRNSEQEFRDFEKVIEEVAQSWDSYSSVQQAAIAKAFSGTRQQNRFLALMEGYNKTLELTEVAANSAGTAVEKFNNSYMESLEAKQNALQASFESMILNTDFSEVYSGILDATTALVEFIDKTNTLNGVVTGLAVNGMVKAFLAVKTGISEAYIALNKYGNALNIVKQTKISTQDFERLLLLTNSLSASQMKLILTSKNLTAEQKMQIVTNAALSEEEKALMIQTYGLTAANTGLTAATTTLGNAFKGLWATLVANPMIVVTAAVSAAVMAYQTYNQKLEETRRANIDNATAASEHADELKKQYDEYMRLASIQDKTISQEEEFKTAVDSIIASLGSKADALKELTVGTDEYASALARATKEELQSQAVAATIGRKASEEEFQDKIWSDWSGSQVSIDSNSKGKSLSDEAQKAVDIVSESLKEFETVNRTWKNISWDIDSNNPIEALEFYNSLVEAREKLVLASEDDESLLDTEIYEDLNTAINSMSESLDTYIEKLYEEEKLNYMAQNGIPTTTEEYSAMEEAITGAAGSSETLQDKFQDLLMTDFAPLINEAEEVEKTIDSVTSGMADPSLSISQTVDQLNTQLKPAFDSLNSAWNDIFSDDEFKLNSIDILSTCDSIKSKLDDMKELGLDVDYSAFENFVRVLNDSESDTYAVDKAFDSLANSIAQAALTGAEDFRTMKAALEDLGVVNSDIIAFQELINNTNALEETIANAGLTMSDFVVHTEDGSIAATDAATAFIEEMVGAENCQQALALLQLQQMLCNENSLNTTDDINACLTLAQAAGVAAESLSWLANVSAQYDKAVEIGDTVAQQNLAATMKSIKERINKELADFQPNAVDFSGVGKNAKSAGKKAGKDYKDALKEQLSDLDSVISGITSRIDDQISSINEQKSAALDSIDAQKEALEEAKESAVAALEEERQKRLDVIEAQRKQIEQNIKAKQKVIDGINAEIKAMRDANSQRKLQNDLMKAQYELERLQNQHTILQYSEGKGIHYVSNTKDIRSQKQAVEDAKLEIEIANKEKQIDLIEKEIDKLNESLDLLSEQEDQINDHYDKLIKQTEDFYDKQLKNLEKQRKETESYFESLIKNLENSKSKYQELTEILEKAELSAKLKQLGIDEEALLNGSEEEFNKLKDAYMNIVFQLNEGNDEVLNSLRELSGYEGTAPSMLEDSNTKLGAMNDELGNANKEVGNVNSSLGETASTTSTVATNVGTVVDGLNQMPESGKVSGLAGEFETLAEKIGEVAKALGISEGQAVGTLFQAMSNLNNVTLGGESEGIIGQFTLLKQAILDVIETIGSSEAQTIGSLMASIAQLNSITLDESIIKQFNSLKTAIDSVTAAISGGGGESSEGEGSGSKSAGGKSGSQGSKGNGESGGGDSLTGAIESMGDTAKKVIGEPDAEGDGTVIGEFGSMETAVNDVRDAIGTGDSEGSKKSGNGSEGEGDGTLIGSIENLGVKTAEEMGESGGDGIIGRFEEFRNVIGDAENHVQGINHGLDEIDGKEVECTIKVNIETSGGGLPAAIGAGMNLGSATYEAKYLGNAHVEGTALASGNWAVQSDEKKALVGEKGFEIIVRSGRFFTVGNNGAEMTDIKKGDIVFNHEQSQNLLKYGHISGRGKAYADGTVGAGKILASDGSILRELQPGDPMYDMMQKFDAYFNSMDGNLEKLVPNSFYDHQKQMENMVKQITNNSIVNNTRNVQQPVTIQVGDINLTGVQDVNGLAHAITTRLPNAMLQEMHRR